MKQAFVFLQNEATEDLEWLLADGGPGRPERGNGALEELAPKLTGYQVIAIASANQVTLTHTELEFIQPAKLRKAVGYALEEQLSQDVEDLHFALGRIESGHTQVAVIRNDLLETWRDAFASAGITLRAITVDLLLLPWKENSWSILLCGDDVLVRTGEFTGFTAEREGLEDLIVAVLESEEMPESINTWYCGDRIKPMQWADSAPSITTPPCPNGKLGVMAGQWDSRQTLNLLQGGHSSETDFGKLFRPWRWAAVLLAVWLGVQTGGQWLERQRLDNQVTQINQEMENIYRRTFPEARKVVNPRVQMEQRLRELKGSGNSGDGDFIPLLAKSTEVLEKHSNTLLNSVNFRNGSLTLQMSAKNLSDLDNLKNDIAAVAGLEAELAAADSQAGKASAQIRIKSQ